MKQKIFVLVLMIFGVLLYPDESSLINHLNQTVKASDIFELVETLASPEYEGRLTGTDGYKNEHKPEAVSRKPTDSKMVVCCPRLGEKKSIVFNNKRNRKNDESITLRSARDSGSHGRLDAHDHRRLSATRPLLWHPNLRRRSMRDQLRPQP